MLSRLLLNPYTLGALALVFVGMSGAIGWYAWDAAAERAKAVAAQAEAARVRVERDTALAISAQKDKEIARMERQAAINNEIMVDLHTAMQDLSAKASETNQALTELETTNEGVKIFLDTALPAELKQLLNVR
jgi:hypothetical protein